MKKISTILSFIIFFANAISQSTDIWIQKADFPGQARYGATGFSIGNKGYIGTGYDGTYKNDFWEYDPEAGTWTQKADFGGSPRAEAVGFSIGNKGYVGTGYNGGYKSEFWEFDPSTNTWKKKASPETILSAVGFSIGNKGYIGTGRLGNAGTTVFLEYDPIKDTWTQKANFSGGDRHSAVGFSIGDKGYIGTGYDKFYTDDTHVKKDFWEYDPANDTWTQKADFGGRLRASAVGFSIGDKGYIGTGNNGAGNITKDFWEYDPATNTWTQKADFGGEARAYAVGFSIGDKGYIGTGYSSDYSKDFWEYTPSSILPLHLTNFTATLQKKDALLNWQTANEINTSYFNIQRSFNGVNFITIAKKNAAGNSLAQKYNYTDKNVTALQKQKIFYRLQMADKDGTTAYSNIAELNVNNNSGIAFFIYPNPAKDKLHINISCTENEILNIRITDMYGRELYAEKISVVAGSVNHNIDVNKLAKGIYTIQLISDKGVSKGKFVKE